MRPSRIDTVTSRRAAGARPSIRRPQRTSRSPEAPAAGGGAQTSTAASAIPDNQVVRLRKVRQEYFGLGRRTNDASSILLRSMTPQQIALLAAAAAGGGAMNALAGGGTLLTFPALLFMGESAIVANATSTVALLPGAAASLAGYRREVATHRSWLRTFFLPSLLGGALGSFLLLRAPERTLSDPRRA